MLEAASSCGAVEAKQISNFSRSASGLCAALAPPRAFVLPNNATPSIYLTHGAPCHTAKLKEILFVHPATRPQQDFSEHLQQHGCVTTASETRDTERTVGHERECETCGGVSNASVPSTNSYPKADKIDSSTENLTKTWRLSDRVNKQGNNLSGQDTAAVAAAAAAEGVCNLTRSFSSAATR